MFIRSETLFVWSFNVGVRLIINNNVGLTAIVEKQHAASAIMEIKITDRKRYLHLSWSRSILKFI